jgi:hypothetical protein
MDIIQLIEYFKELGTLTIKYLPKVARWEATLTSKHFKITGYPGDTLLESLTRLYAIAEKNRTALLILNKE